MVTSQNEQIFRESIFHFLKMDKNKCPKLENSKYFPEKYASFDFLTF